MKPFNMKMLHRLRTGRELEPSTTNSETNVPTAEAEPIPEIDIPEPTGAPQRQNLVAKLAKSEEITLSDEQAAVMLAIEQRHNILVTGPAGTGKSTLLKALVKKYGDRMPITATTGIAAVGVGGVTIHSWAGLGLAEGKPEAIARNIRDNKAKALANIVSFNRLAIDEISMMSAGLFDKIDKVFRILRKNDRPFGGMQLMLFGDFCLKAGTGIVMHDGSLRKIERVKVGDLIMGPDSRPRRVKRVFRGEAQLYRVQQANADEYECTGNHLIQMKRRGNSGRFPKLPNEIAIKASELPSKSKKFLEVFGGYKAGLLQFKKRRVPIEPYFLGMWLGNGESDGYRISDPDPETIEYCEGYAKRLRLFCEWSKEGDKNCNRISITTGKRGNKSLNQLKIWLRKYALLNNKHIPEDYLLNSEQARLELLAGLIDSDGCWSGNRFTFTSVLRRLAEDVKRLADHLGFRTGIFPVAHGAWTVSIGGETWRIPTKKKRKQSKPRALGRERLNSTLSVTPSDFGAFAGIEVDGDNLFLLADGTVTHNCQLPPVTKERENDSKEVFAFESRAWAEAEIKTALLTKIFRQSDPEFAEALNSIRVGEVTPLVSRLLNSRYIKNRAPDPHPEIEPVTIHTHNGDVEGINDARLAQLAGDAQDYKASDTGKEAGIKLLEKNCLAPTVLRLKIGAQVMLLNNLDPANGLANGSIGRVTKLGALPEVQFQNGARRLIEGHSWEIKDNGKVIAERAQLPLRLAWAITAHKSQGMTLDKIAVYLGKCFEDGQAYVALSRARTLDGLFIESGGRNSIRASEKAIAFYRNAARV